MIPYSGYVKKKNLRAKDIAKTKNKLKMILLMFKIVSLFFRDYKR